MARGCAASLFVWCWLVRGVCPCLFMCRGFVCWLLVGAGWVFWKKVVHPFFVAPGVAVVHCMFVCSFFVNHPPRWCASFVNGLVSCWLVCWRLSGRKKSLKKEEGKVTTIKRGEKD